MSNFNKDKFYLAPLRGITDRFFRSVYEQHFGPFDYCLAPFVSTVRGDDVRLCYLKDTLPEHNDTRRLIPQIIGNETPGFVLLTRKFAELGFKSVNWNLGCPSPLITKKKRGSGFLPYFDEIKMFLDTTLPQLLLPMSIKVRLGYQQKKDLERLIPIFNQYPLKEIIIHPRTGMQMYSGDVDLDSFETCYRLSKHTVVYNGNLNTPEDLLHLKNRFPELTHWMIGRGLIKHPPLLPLLRGEDRSIFPYSRIRHFVDDLYRVNSEVLPAAGLLGKMKELWGFLGLGLDSSGELSNAIVHASTVDQYKSIVADFFESFDEDEVAPVPITKKI